MKVLTLLVSSFMGVGFSHVRLPSSTLSSIHISTISNRAHMARLLKTTLMHAPARVVIHLGHGDVAEVLSEYEDNHDILSDAEHPITVVLGSEEIAGSLLEYSDPNNMLAGMSTGLNVIRPWIVKCLSHIGNCVYWIASFISTASDIVYLVFGVDLIESIHDLIWKNRDVSGLLLEYEADPNILDDKGMTALGYAVGGTRKY